MFFLFIISPTSSSKLVAFCTVFLELFRLRPILRPQLRALLLVCEVPNTTTYKRCNCQAIRPANCYQPIPPNRFRNQFAADKFILISQRSRNVHRTPRDQGYASYFQEIYTWHYYKIFMYDVYSQYHESWSDLFVQSFFLFPIHPTNSTTTTTINSNTRCIGEFLHHHIIKANVIGNKQTDWVNSLSDVTLSQVLRFPASRPSPPYESTVVKIKNVYLHWFTSRKLISVDWIARVHIGQGKVREKNYFSRSGKSQWILNLVSEFRIST